MSRLLWVVVLITAFASSRAVVAEENLVNAAIKPSDASIAPKGLVIVPWQAQLPDTSKEAMQFSVADDIFRPVDRQVFRRQLSYYRELFSAPAKLPDSKQADSNSSK